jgi:hypothetical protein
VPGQTLGTKTVPVAAIVLLTTMERRGRKWIVSITCVVTETLD